MAREQTNPHVNEFGELAAAVSSTQKGGSIRQCLVGTSATAGIIKTKTLLNTAHAAFQFTRVATQVWQQS